MKNKTVLKRTEVSPGLGLIMWGFIAFFLHYSEASMFWWGFTAVIFMIWVISVIVRWATEDTVELFDENGKIRKDLLS